MIIDAIGHCPHLSAPEETIAAMKAYLEAELAPCDGPRPCDDDRSS